jgi:anti-sigma factor RsiW
VRERLAEHLLGTLEGPTDLEVRRHLRGCSGCRREMIALGEGVDTLARAAHEVTPPEELRERVLTVLDQEWSEPSAIAEPDAEPHRWLAVAAAVAVLFVGTLVWGLSANGRAQRYEVAAHKYDALLGVLGGENVRVGEIKPAGTQQLEGSVVLYDSKVGQSWALILVRAPGMSGRASVVLSTSDGHTIDLRPLEFSDGGEASTWLVTSADLHPFHRLTVNDPSGAVLATAAIETQ